MSSRNANSEHRNISITFSVAVLDDGVPISIQNGAPLDAYKAAVELVYRLEDKYSKLGAEGVPDMKGRIVVATGSIPSKVHVYQLTTTMASGKYEVLYSETRPNLDGENKLVINNEPEEPIGGE